MTRKYSNEYLFTLGTSSRNVPVVINGQEVQMIIDSESTMKLFDSGSFVSLSKRPCERVMHHLSQAKRVSRSDFLVAQNPKSGCLLDKKNSNRA